MPEGISYCCQKNYERYLDPFDFAANELEASSVHLPPQRSPKLLEVLGQALP